MSQTGEKWPSWENKTPQYFIVDTMAADDLVTEGASVSAAMVLA